MPFRRRVRECCATLIAMLMLCAPAAHAAVVKDGLWDVARTGDGKDCLASLVVQDGTVFGLPATNGAVTFAVAAKKRWPKAAAGTLSTDKVRFDFTPRIEKDLLSLDDTLNDRALAALREAEEVLIGLDGRPVFAVEVKGTGLPAALDGVIACSRGEAGWWGKGAIVSAGGAGAAPAKAAAAGPEPVYHGDSLWGVTVGATGVCVAQAAVDDRTLQLLSAEGLVGLAVAGDKVDLPQGRRGLIETDSFKLDFKPDYDGKRYLATGEAFDSPSLFAIRRAKSIRVLVDGKLVVDATLDGSGFADALDAVAACSRGESGWWGKGAPPKK